LIAWGASLPPHPTSRQIEQYYADRRAGARKSPTPPAAKVDRDAAFKKKDLNRDNQLTLEEYLYRFPKPDEGRQRFPRFDKNGDGVLSYEEFVHPNGR
jgi:hypothetical protein